MQWENKKIVVTGGSGFLGSFVVDLLRKRGANNIIVPRSKESDLRIKENCEKITKGANIVFHLAAKVGGIGLNQKLPGELFYDNLIMGTNLMEAARKNNIQKFVALGTICSYPKFTPLPFTEDSIWNGYPEETNAPYGLAKKMLLVQSQAYRQQYNFNSIVVFPTNLYGPRDNFDPTTSHVIPALILKVYNAKKSNSNTITVWGDGTPTRDFLYVEDAARGLILAAERYNDINPINLGSGQEISIRELVQTISRLMDFNGEIKWDTSKPNGQPRRCVSNEKAKRELGFETTVTIEAGLKKTIDWFLQNPPKEVISV